MRVYLALMTLTLAAALAQGQPTRPAASATASQPAPGQAELAAAIVRDAAPGYLPAGNVQGYVRRGFLLSQMALRLDPGNRKACEVQAEAAEVLERFDQAAAAQECYLRGVNYRDYTAFLRWLRYRLAGLSDAQSREQVLRQAADNGQLEDAERAAALANLGAMEEGRGDPKHAMELYEQSLKLDPSQANAISGLVRMGDGGLAAAARLDVALLRNDPLSASAAWDFARLCQSAGLSQQALSMYDLALAAPAARGLTPAAAMRFGWLDALLDAGEFQRAIAECAEGLKAEPVDLPLAERAVEAHRQLGQTKEAEAVIQRMEKVYQSMAAANVLGKEAAALAWFHLMYMNRPASAQKWVAIATDRAPDDPYVQRVWGVVMLTGDQAKDAAATLRALTDKDAFAASALVECAMTSGNPKDAAAAINAAAKLPRTGLAWRELARTAAKHKLDLPPVPEAADVAKEVEALGSALPDLAKAPSKLISLKLEPLRADVPPGQPLLVRATLTNTSPMTLALGEQGLMMPRMVILVELTQSNVAPVRQPISAAWAAPRYLKSGASLEQIVRIDAGHIADALLRDPIDPAQLDLKLVADPALRQEQYQSVITGLPTASARMRRTPLLAADDEQTYYTALVGLVQKLQGKDPVAAMEAAEITVSLLAMGQAVDAADLRFPDGLRAGLRTPELLSMLRYCLQQGSEAVRLRATGAMRILKLTDLMTELLLPCLADASPLVRARAVEVLATSDPKANARVLEYLSQKDPDELVRQMAAAFLPKP